MAWLIALGIVAALVMSVVLYINLHPQFGGKVNTEENNKLSSSPQWKDGKFENISETKMEIGLSKMPKLLREQFSDRKSKAPKKDIPIEWSNESPQSDHKFSFRWLGHSAALLHIGNTNLLIDPMLGPDASPIAPFSTKRFTKNSLDVIDKFPKLDAILITHDHYDHLDYASIKKLIGKTETYLVALGVKRHLVKWGIPAEQITEFDWWDSTSFQGIDITFTPSRHFSGRGATDRAKSLWGGFVFKNEEISVYWSGDGGYDSHFKEIGEKLGPFDIGFMENGQYHPMWHVIHMYPEEAIQAAIDAKVAVSIPVHWAGFTLAPHEWTDPIKRFVAEGNRLNHPMGTPKIGHLISLDKAAGVKDWWSAYAS